jgi:predicted metalloprotease
MLNRYRTTVFIAVVALAAILAPLGATAQSTVELVVGDIDAYWAGQFANLGLTYAAPSLRSVDGAMETSCGMIDPYFSPGAYCAADQTVYYSTAWAPDAPGTEVIWWTVLSHEWGHHIQWQVDTGVTSLEDAELQADCFAGAYLRHAEEIGLVSPGAVTMALSLTQSAGDVSILMPHDDAVHGNKAERALAFMSGMNGSVADCGFGG